MPSVSDGSSTEGPVSLNEAITAFGIGISDNEFPTSHSQKQAVGIQACDCTSCMACPGAIGMETVVLTRCRPDYVHRRGQVSFAKLQTRQDPIAVYPITFVLMERQ